MVWQGRRDKAAHGQDRSGEAGESRYGMVSRDAARQARRGLEMLGKTRSGFA